MSFVQTTSPAMRLSLCLTAFAAWAAVACAQPATVNFNLVQVNHYHGQERLYDSVATPGARMVIDLGNPTAYHQFVRGVETASLTAPVVIDVFPDMNEAGGVELPWETQTVLRSTTGTDSFLVTSSRAGCPGTEIRPSVAVAFGTPNGWSDPPIRFGPLARRAICPLGYGRVLEVSVIEGGAPRVRLRDVSETSVRR